MVNNKDTFGYCIDNWSEFGGPRDKFHKNIQTYLPNRTNFKIVDKDCWSVDIGDIPDKINIYLYDGAHTYEDHKKAITHYSTFLSKYSIILVDDWTCDWVHVKQGTLDGLKEAGLIIHYSEEIGLVNTSTNHQGGDTFWNGCGVFVCENPD